MASGNSLWSFVPAGNEPALTNYGSLGSANARVYIAFDASTQETVCWTENVPSQYAGGNVNWLVRCMAASATSGTASFGISAEKMNDATTDLDAADSFDTEALCASPVTVPATAGIHFDVPITLATADMDGLVAGDLARFRLRRDVANDSAAGDIRVLAVYAVEA